LRRTQFASPDLWKSATKQPTRTKTKKKKNQSTNIFGETLGRLHLEGKKSKALRLAEALEKGEEREAIESELGKEGEEIDNEFEQAYGFSRDDIA
jgi:ribosome production factor 2